MKLSINIRNWGPYSTRDILLECARAADASGLDTVWVNERLTSSLGDGWQPGPVPIETLRQRIGQLRELMAERGRDFSQLSISTFGDPKELQENPDKLTALSELGVQEMVLFMTALDTDTTLTQLEEAANAFMS